jgi:hypothetical protein
MIPALIATGAGLAQAGMGLYGTYMQTEAQKKAAAAELAAKKQAAAQIYQNGQITDNEYKNLIQQIDDYYGQRGSLGTQADVSAYKNAISNYKPEDYAAVDPGFNFKKTKEDYLNPYYSQIIGDTANQLQHTAAGAGMGRGTGAALNIAKGVADKSNELYRTAMQDYQNERDFAYKSYADAIKNNQARLDALRSGNEYKMSLQGNLAQDYYNTMDARMGDNMQAQQDRLNAKQVYANSIAGLY